MGTGAGSGGGSQAGAAGGDLGAAGGDLGAVGGGERACGARDPEGMQGEARAEAGAQAGRGRAHLRGALAGPPGAPVPAFRSRLLPSRPRTPSRGHGKAPERKSHPREGTLVAFQTRKLHRAPLLADSGFSPWWELPVQTRPSLPTRLGPGASVFIPRGKATGPSGSVSSAIITLSLT